MNYSLIITAGGVGSRFKSEQPKQFSLINNKPILQVSIEAFSTFDIKQCIITSPEDYIDQTKKVIQSCNVPFPITCIAGGPSRAESVINAFNQLALCDAVLIHDAVRPFISKDVIKRVLKQIPKYDAVIPGVSVSDTIKIVSNDLVQETLDRRRLIAVQTPQAVNYKKYAEAIKIFSNKRENLTDDASLIELNGGSVNVVDGDINNIKITYLRDIV